MRTEHVHPLPVIFDGDNRICTICQEELEDGERVVRLRFRHIFHAECWMFEKWSTMGPHQIAMMTQIAPFLEDEESSLPCGTI